MCLRLKKKILLTGSTGTLGYNILKLLADSPDHQIIAPIRSRNPKLAEFSDRVEFIDNELTDTAHTAQIFERAKPDVIVHCAASGLRIPKGSWFDLMQFNVETTMRLFQMNCRFDHNSHFIYISTGLVYREQARPLQESDPIETLHPYGASKAAADSMLQAAAAEFKRSLTILRPFAFTGPHDAGGRLFPAILNAAAKGESLPMTSGLQIRDFCAVGDIARAVLLCLDKPQTSLIEKYNLGSGESRPLRELVESVCSELDLKVNFRFGALSMHEYEPKHLVANITHAREVLRWKPHIRLAYAVSRLAKEIAPHLELREVEKTL